MYVVIEAFLIQKGVFWWRKAFVVQKKKSSKRISKSTKVVKKKKKVTKKGAPARKLKKKPARAIKEAPVKEKKTSKAKKKASSKAKSTASKKTKSTPAKATKGKGTSRLVSVVQKVTLAARLAVEKSQKIPKKKKASPKNKALAPVKSTPKKTKALPAPSTSSTKRKASTEARLAALENKCREPACTKQAILAEHCRLHYIKNWRRIKRKGDILSTGRLNNYIESLVEKYPDKYLDAIEFDLSNDQEWINLINELEPGQADDVLSQGEEEIIPNIVGKKNSRDYGEDEEF